MVAKVGLPFANWEPDKSSLSGAASEAKGVISQGGRYAPLKDFLPLLSGAAMNDTAIGAAGFYDQTGNVRIFLGDAGKLYEIQSRAPVDVSKIGGYTANRDWGWSFEQFGTSIYATARGLSQIQSFEFGVSARFADVTTGPGASDTLFRVREFLFSGLGNVLKNSCFNNPTDWNPASPTGIQAAEVNLPADGGDIVVGTGGQFGLVFQERKIHRLTYTGSPNVPFQLDEIEDKRGALGPNAISRYGMLTFFASDDGIYATDGAGESVPLGDATVSKYFADNLNYSAKFRVSIGVDVARKLVKVAFPTGGNSYCNELLIYSISDKRWTHDTIDLDLVFEAPKQGVTVDDDAGIIAIAGTTVVDDIDIPVDSPVWAESRKQIMAVNSGHVVGTFEGPNRAAVLETGYGEVLPGHMGFLTEIYPLIDSDEVTCSVTTKLKRLSDNAVNGTAVAMNVHGFCPVLAHARFMRARVMVPATKTWTEAIGIDWDARPAGGL